MKTTKQIAENLIAHAKRKNIYIVLRFQDYKRREMTVKNEKTDNSSLVRIIGCGIHAFTKEGFTGFAAIDTIEEENLLKDTLDTAIESALIAKQNGFERIPQIFEQKPHKDKVHERFPRNPFTIKNTKLERDLQSFHRRIKKDYPKYSLLNKVRFESDHKKVYRSDGTDIDMKTLNSILFSMIFINQGKNQNEYLESHYGQGYEILSKRKHLDRHKFILDHFLKYIINYSKSETLKTGNYPLLLDGGISGVFMHEAFGHTAESDTYYHKSPLLKNKKINKGKKIAGQFVSIIDHARKNERGFVPYSDFGIKRKEAVIIRKGRIQNLISDLFTYKKTSTSLIGAGKACSYEDMPVPRMSCTELKLRKERQISISYDTEIPNVKAVQGTLKQKKIFKKYPRIIYLVGSSGGHVDSYEGNFQFASLISFIISADKIVQVKPVSFSGKTLEVLKSIEYGFGGSIEWPGFCGKSGQYVNVNSKSPTILLSPNKYITIG